MRAPMPIQGPHGAVGSVPWHVIEPHRRQAGMNHHRSLETLQHLGGLSWGEALAILQNAPMRAVTGWSEREAQRRVELIVQGLTP